jgi:hypothetical protein
MALASAPTLRAMLGRDPHEASADHIRRLINDQVRESDWLGSKGREPKDVAKSVTVLANAGGCPPRLRHRRGRTDAIASARQL